MGSSPSKKSGKIIRGIPGSDRPHEGLQDITPVQSQESKYDGSIVAVDDEARHSTHNSESLEPGLQRSYLDTNVTPRPRKLLPLDGGGSHVTGDMERLTESKQPMEANCHQSRNQKKKKYENGHIANTGKAELHEEESKQLKEENEMLKQQLQTTAHKRFAAQEEVYKLQEENDGLRFRLWSRVKKGDGFLNADELYERFKLETIEALQENSILTRKDFSANVKHVFDVESTQKRLSTGDRCCIYPGLILKPLTDLPAATKIHSDDISDLSSLIPEAFCPVKVTDSEHQYQFGTNYISNGQEITKVVTFNNNLKWSLSVAGNDINLASYGIDNSFQLTSESIAIIYSIVKSMDLCVGMEIRQSTNCTRYHTIEDVRNKNADKTSRIIRSRMCKRIVSVTSKTHVCRTCQKMTFGQNKITNSKAEREEENSVNLSTLKHDLQSAIPFASNQMIELLISQVDNGNVSPTGRRWSKTIINVCLQLYSRSPVGYNVLRSSGMLILPSPQLGHLWDPLPMGITLPCVEARQRHADVI